MSGCVLNERNEKTKHIIHLLVTSLCSRHCKYCCNKQYDLSDIPYVTDNELKEADTICITGGEPFEYSSPEDIARYYKKKYDNIKNVYVYTNAKELRDYLACGRKLRYIDGLSVSIKNKEDKEAFELVSYCARILRSNRLYVFDDDLIPKYLGNFTLIKREWEKDFVPADDSIFRKI